MIKPTKARKAAKAFLDRCIRLRRVLDQRQRFANMGDCVLIATDQGRLVPQMPFKMTWAG